jgi:valyl-tRNA synthetase
VQTLYHFFWDDFCDWYIELTKADVTSEETSAQRDEARTRLISVLDQALRLLHPFMPYITEDLWLRLPGEHRSLLHRAYAGAEPTIMLAAYPEPMLELINEQSEAEMSFVKLLVTAVRNIRSEMNIKPGQPIEIIIGIANPALRKVIEENSDVITRLTRASRVSVASQLDAPKASARAVFSAGGELAVPLEGLIDFAQEQQRLTKEKEKLQAEATKLEALLANPQFAERAPAEKVAELRARISDIAQRNTQLDQTIANLE